MTEQRTKNLVTATVAAAVAILVFLLAILSVQTGKLIVQKRKEAQLNALFQEYNDYIKGEQEEIKRWEEDWQIIERAHELGYDWPGLK